MDERGASHYMRQRPMELLLLLSAFLTALTGAITGVRAPETRVEQVQVLAAATTQAVQAAGLATPALTFAERPATPARFRAAEPAPSAPLYLSRRRE